ncbi:MAG TPA: hypothetical protein VEU47_00940, partial [Candidatus Cybelea sp.]|nr:hypothetical protein [Candidatus Cybelea sp.]
LILALVVIVIGGIGSIRGSLVAAIIVGLLDTVGRGFLPGLLVSILPRTLANAVGPALASMLIYLLMAAILLFRPRGLFPAAGAGHESQAAAAERVPLPPRREWIVGGVFMAVLALVPVGAAYTGQHFYVDLMVRAMIFGIAALSLNLIVGFGGMVSFGHAAFLGLGAYVVGLSMISGLTNGLAQLALVIAVSAAASCVIGALCLRTGGLAFIMITLAFAQLLYFVGVGLRQFGGDDGFTFRGHSGFGSVLDLGNPISFYYAVWALLALCLLAIARLINSRFGLALQAIRSNERRAQALGLPSYRYKLCAFVIAGTICGVAGALLANLTQFVGPAYMHWTRSGELLIMVIAGGLTSVSGPVLGAVAYLLLEEVLSSYTEYWQLILGPLLVLLVLFARGGIMSTLDIPSWRQAAGRQRV